MATHISELTWWKARDMDQAETRSSVWTTPSHRYSLRGPNWATASQPTTTTTADGSWETHAIFG
jgi:hypothetical protein